MIKMTIVTKKAQKSYKLDEDNFPEVLRQASSQVKNVPQIKMVVVSKWKK